MARLTGSLMIAAALVSNAAFIGLGAIFGYPDVLREPAEQILARYNADRAAIIALFALLAVAAAALIPVAIGLGGRYATPIGVLAGIVQVLGLIRWVYAVPVLADSPGDPASLMAFEVLHAYLGVGVGETLGYIFTSAWTLLIVARLLMPRWLVWLGAVSALAIVAGVAEPAGLAAAGLVNFIGYLLWSVWLIAFGAMLVTARLDGRSR